ncbi:Cdc6/Cdc18 family protein [Halorubrum pallidum]|uniref:ORC1-type DNA replication protein n=1 Tax=Halorubrum pallidum TaxID=1526114 RepID=A0ABD5T7K3_9EURY
MDRLRDAYIPDEVLHRRDQIEELRMALMPAVNGDTPSHPFLVGPNGTGKTLVTKHVTSQMKEYIDEKNEDRPPEEQQAVSIVYTNCADCTSGYAATIRAANQMLPEGERLSETGHSSREVNKRLFNAINEQGDIVVLVLDEIGGADDLNDLFYQASRGNQPGTYLDGTKLCVICTANNLSFRDNFNSAVRSSLVEHTIEFPAYDANEIRDILEMRADKAFTEQGIHESAVQLAAALAGQQNGDARYGLDMLLKGGQYAMNAGESPVTDDHIRRGKEKVDRTRMDSQVSTYSETGQLIIASLAHAMKKAENMPESAQITGATVQKIYERACEALDRNVVQKQNFYSYLRDFSDNEIVEVSRNTNKNGNEYRLYYPPESVLQAISPELQEELRSETKLID